jgi:hypothetical protein
MEYPVAEMADRYTIAKLKHERLNQCTEEMIQLYASLGDRAVIHGFEIGQLYAINGLIWDMEAEIRQGVIGKESYEEIGRRALLIRHMNKKRVGVRNLIANIEKQPIDVKGNHASE